jgi:four helix bundle protein
MFDFEKLEVYQLVKEQTNLVFKQIAKTEGLDSLIRDSWKNASLQVLLQLVQASGRVSTSEKKNLLTAARGYVFECSAILDLLKASGEVDAEKFEELYNNYERISKMLLGMFRSYESKVD